MLVLLPILLGSSPKESYELMAGADFRFNDSFFYDFKKEYNVFCDNKTFGDRVLALWDFRDLHIALVSDRSLYEFMIFGEESKYLLKSVEQIICLQKNLKGRQYCYID